MARKQTKADLILGEARERVEKAHLSVTATSSALEAALAVRQAHQQAYDDLERSLAPKPRKVKPAATKATPKQPKLSPTGDGPGKDGTNGES